MKFLLAESGATLYDICQDGWTYDGKQFQVRVTDTTIDTGTNTMWTVAESVDTAHHNWVKERRALELTRTFGDTFESDWIIAYDDIMPSVKTYFEGAPHNFELVPASWLKIRRLAETTQSAVEAVLQATAVWLEVSKATRAETGRSVVKIEFLDDSKTPTGTLRVAKWENALDPWPTLKPNFVDEDGDLDGSAGVLDTDYDGRADTFPSSWSYAEDPGDIVTETSYLDTDEVSSVTDPRDYTTSYIYDGAGRLVTEARPEGAVSRYWYDKNGNRVLERDPNGNWTKRFYDERNREYRTVLDLNGTAGVDLDTQMAGGYDPFLPDWDGQNNSAAWEDAEPATGVADIVTSMQYDAVGNVRFVTDARGFETETEYDGANRPFKVIDALGGTTVTEYDANGNPVLVTDAMLNPTTITYDAFSRPRVVTGAAGTVTETVYDPNGNVTEVKLAGVAMSTYVYDAFDRQISETRVDGVVATDYFRDGSVLSVTDAKEQFVGNEYDFAGRLVRSTHLDDTDEVAVREVRVFAYDKAGNVTGATEYAGPEIQANVRCVTSYLYDGLGRAIHETRLNGAGNPQSDVDSVYDPNGNRITVTYDGAGGRVLDSTYDRANRLVTVTDSALNAPSNVTAYAYDPNGNRLSCALPSGLVHRYAYDELNRVVAAETVNASGEIVYAVGDVSNAGDGTCLQEGYSYDTVGNRLAIDEQTRMADGTYAARDLRYVYDNEYRLLAEWWDDDPAAVTTGGMSYEYEYDAYGNRTRMAAGGVVTEYDFTYLDPTQLASWTRTDGVTCGYDYDDNGSRTSKSVVSTDGGGGPEAGTTEYFYDTFDRLVSVDTDSDGVADFEAVYDYRTRRLSKTEISPADGGGEVARTTTFRYDGGVSYSESWQEDVGGNSGGAFFVRGSGLGGGIGSILYSERDDGSTVLREDFVFNPVGHTVATVDASGGADNGSVKSANLYEAFGNIVRLVSAEATGFRGEYHNGTDFPTDGTDPAIVRIDAQVDFVESENAPRWPPAGIDRADPDPTDEVVEEVAQPFCVKWTGEIEAPTDGLYEFTLTYTGGARLWVDSVKYHGYWNDAQDDIDAPDGGVFMGAGDRLDIELHYQYTGSGGPGTAGITLSWSKDSGTPEVVPPSALFTTGLKWVDVRYLGEKNTSGDSTNNRLANTKERDFSIGLDNHGFRYYDPEIGRYTTRDPAGYRGGVNEYLYVWNNPINHIDPLGLNGALDDAKAAKKEWREADEKAESTRREYEWAQRRIEHYEGEVEKLESRLEAAREDNDPEGQRMLEREIERNRRVARLYREGLEEKREAVEAAERKRDESLAAYKASLRRGMEEAKAAGLRAGRHAEGYGKVKKGATILFASAAVATVTMGVSASVQAEALKGAALWELLLWHGAVTAGGAIAPSAVATFGIRDVLEGLELLTGR